MEACAVTLRLFNTRTRQIEALTPIDPGCVRMYCCGPTVHAYAHIGNLRTYVFEDVLRRTLELFGHEVQHVMNITDVGHLQSDADVGDDKMEVAARREGQSPWEIALCSTLALAEAIASRSASIVLIIPRTSSNRCNSRTISALSRGDN
jgi:cysteinyl-tRNA synthetase